MNFVSQLRTILTSPFAMICWIAAIVPFTIVIDSYIALLVPGFRERPMWLFFLVLAAAGSLVLLGFFEYMVNVRRAFKMHAVAGVLIVSMICSAPLHGQVRTQLLQVMFANGAPLIAAIRRFEKEHGKPPAALSELVPNYIAAIPGTGLAPFPRFVYSVGVQDSWLSNYGSDSWELRAEREGFLDGEHFVYRSSEEYPDRTGAMGGHVTKYPNGWAYHDESSD